MKNRSREPSSEALSFVRINKELGVHCRFHRLLTRRSDHGHVDGACSDGCTSLHRILSSREHFDLKTLGQSLPPVVCQHGDSVGGTQCPAVWVGAHSPHRLWDDQLPQEQASPGVQRSCRSRELLPRCPGCEKPVFEKQTSKRRPHSGGLADLWVQGPTSSLARAGLPSGAGGGHGGRRAGDWTCDKPVSSGSHRAWDTDPAPGLGSPGGGLSRELPGAERALRRGRRVRAEPVGMPRQLPDAQ